MKILLAVLCLCLVCDAAVMPSIGCVDVLTGEVHAAGSLYKKGCRDCTCSLTGDENCVLPPGTELIIPVGGCHMVFNNVTCTFHLVSSVIPTMPCDLPPLGYLDIP